MKKKLNCAVIGMGVGSRHAFFYLKSSKTNLLKIYEKNKKKRHLIKKKFPKVQLVNNEDEIFKDPKIDLVSIASYDNYHFDQIMKAAKFKKNLFVEKPICLFLYQLRQIKKIVEKTKINFSCNLILRENNQFKKIQNIIKKKMIGNIFFAEGDYNYGRLEKIEKGWRGKIPYYSVTHGGAIHMIDLILWYLNELPNKVIGFGNRLVVKNKYFKQNDFTTGILNFKSGKIVKIISNYGCVLPHHHALKIYGNKGSIIHDFRGGAFIKSRQKNKKPIYFNLKTSNEQKANILKCFVEDIINNKKKKLKDNFKNIINSMLISLAIENSIEKKKQTFINYSKLKFND